MSDVYIKQQLYSVFVHVHPCNLVKQHISRQHNWNENQPMASTQGRAVFRLV